MNYKKYYKLILLVVTIINIYFISFPAYCKDSILDDFGKFSMSYYLQPNPEKVSWFLDKLIKDNTFRHDLSRNDFLWAYFFGRAASLSPSLVSEYKKVYLSSDLIGKEFILGIFKIYRTKELENFLRESIGSSELGLKNKIEELLKNPALGKNAIPEKLSDASQLDLTWCDFFVTGTREPIVKIIDVLSWQDRFRDKLTVWLYTKHTNSEKKKLENLLKEAGIDIDSQGKEILSPIDLDCLYSAYLQRSGFNNEISRQGVEIRKILKLSKDDLLYMGTKGSAMWSLQSNAQQHPRVLEYCKQEFERRTDKSKIELSIIIEVVSKGSIEYVPAEEEGMVILKLRKE